MCWLIQSSQHACEITSLTHPILQVRTEIGVKELIKDHELDYEPTAMFLTAMLHCHPEYNKV